MPLFDDGGELAGQLLGLLAMSRHGSAVPWCWPTAVGVACSGGGQLIHRIHQLQR